MPNPYRLSYVMYAPCEGTEDMYMAEVPALPGCRAWGKPLPPELVGTGEFVVAV